jgi:hypothetical protein
MLSTKRIRALDAPKDRQQEGTPLGIWMTLFFSSEDFLTLPSRWRF